MKIIIIIEKRLADWDVRVYSILPQPPRVNWNRFNFKNVNYMHVIDFFFYIRILVIYLLTITNFLTKLAAPPTTRDLSDLTLNLHDI